jgi:hypothetical protein
MSLDASAKNMQAVCKAKEVHLNWFDLDRMGWEEGDVICGLTVIGDEKVATGMMRVTCDAEPGDPSGLEEEEDIEVVEAVSSEREIHAPSYN